MMTHTYATLEISQSAFDEIKAKLEAAGYQHAFHKDGDKLLIDMQGIAVHGDGKPDAAKVNVRMVRNITLQHFGMNEDVDRISAEVEAGKITHVEAIRAFMELYLKLARRYAPRIFRSSPPLELPR